MAGDDELKKSTFAVASSVAFYFVVSLSMVGLNKLLFHGFKFPLFTTWFQLVVAAIGVSIIGTIGQFVPALSFVPPPRFDARTALQVAPLTLIYLGMLCFTNMAMSEVSIFFYQILRSAVIPMNATMSYYLLGTVTSPKAMLMCLVVLVGFTLGSYGELVWNGIGFVYGILSAICCAAYSLTVKKVLPSVNGNMWVLLFYNTVNAIPLMILPMLWLEPSDMWLAHPLMYDTEFWIKMTIAALMGLAINFAYFAQIKFCSPLTSHVSGNTKSTVQALLFWFFLNEPTSDIQLGGLCLTILGSIGYSQVKYSEMRSRVQVSKISSPAMNTRSRSRKSL